MIPKDEVKLGIKTVMTNEESRHSSQGLTGDVYHVLELLYFYIAVQLLYPTESLSVSSMIRCSTWVISVQFCFSVDNKNAFYITYHNSHIIFTTALHCHLSEIFI